MRRLSQFGLFAACCLYLTACSGIELLNASVPDNSFTLKSNIAYGELPRQKLDIYIPKDMRKGNPAPVLMFIHGGSWQIGSKDDYKFVGEAFASKGYVVVIPNYRLYPDVRFPAFIQDAAKAFAWTHTHIGEYGGNANNLFLSGHSAGAHIAMMLTLDSHYLKEAGADPRQIKGTLGLAGPYDFLPLTDPAIQAVFSSAKNLDNTQPIHFARKNTPPIFLATGDNDETVNMKNTMNLAKRLKQEGDKVDVRIYPGVDHMDIVLSLAYRFRNRSPLREEMDAFMEMHSQ